MAHKSDMYWFADGDAYEHYVGRWSRLIGQIFLNWLSPSPGLRWVDVGCGTGALTESILMQVDPEHIIGVEPSEGFISLAKAGITDSRAEFKTGDARSLPCKAASRGRFTPGATKARPVDVLQRE